MSVDTVERSESMECKFHEAEASNEVQSKLKMKRTGGYLINIQTMKLIIQLTKLLIRLLKNLCQFILLKIAMKEFM